MLQVPQQLVALAVAFHTAVGSLAVPNDFCKQQRKWKASVCIYVNNCIENTNGLLNVLNDLKDIESDAADNIFNLRHQENLTSVADLYQEMSTYESIFLSFHSAMPKHNTGIPSEDQKRQKYLDRLSKYVILLNQTTEQLSEKLNVSAIPVNEATSSVGAKCLNKPQSIYICSYHVTDKLNTFLKQWANHCTACLRPRKLSSKNGGKGKKNKGNKKDKKKVKKGGKGKGQGKRNKNSDNKRNKPQEALTQ